MTMHDQRFDRALPSLFVELASASTPDYLEAAIERASSRPQRPAWTYPGRWLPVHITTQAVPAARMPWRQLGILALIGLLLAVAAVAYVGARRDPSPAPPFGLAAERRHRNGTRRRHRDRRSARWRPPSAGGRSRGSGRPMFSPDGTRLAFVRRTGLSMVLMVANADGTNVVQLTPETLEASGWSFAPDGRSLLGVALIDGEPDGPDRNSAMHQSASSSARSTRQRTHRLAIPLWDTGWRFRNWGVPASARRTPSRSSS